MTSAGVLRTLRWLARRSGGGGRRYLLHIKISSTACGFAHFSSPHKEMTHRWRTRNPVFSITLLLSVGGDGRVQLRYSIRICIVTELCASREAPSKWTGECFYKKLFPTDFFVSSARAQRGHCEEAAERNSNVKMRYALLKNGGFTRAVRSSRGEESLPSTLHHRHPSLNTNILFHPCLALCVCVCLRAWVL